LLSYVGLSPCVLVPWVHLPFPMSVMVSGVSPELIKQMRDPFATLQP
jgi:hypothetical protein